MTRFRLTFWVISANPRRSCRAREKRWGRVSGIIPPRADSGDGAIGFAALRKSFMFFTVSADDTSKLKMVEEAGEQLFRPGSLKTPIAPDYPRIKVISSNPPLRWGWPF